MNGFVEKRNPKLFALANVLLLLIAFPATSVGQTVATQKGVEKEVGTEGAQKDQRQIERDLWTVYYAQQVPKYTLVLDSDQDAPLKAIAEPKLRYWNSVREGNNHGELFIWTRNGRCEVAGAFLSYNVWTNLREAAHEFHSFSSERILGSRAGYEFQIAPPGVVFKPIQNAKPPAKSRALRMVQLRRMAKLFEASTQSKAESTLSNESVSLPLRLLDQPIFRYETKEVTDDGAIFAYVTGTDPEVLIAIESRQTDDGPKWFYGAARFTDLPITLKYKNETVWKFDEAETYVGGYEFYRYERQPFSPNLDPEETAKGEAKDGQQEPPAVQLKTNVKGK
jgi:hypothetical protein